MPPPSSGDSPLSISAAAASLLADLSPALARALPVCLPIVLQGMQVRANIRTAVRAVEANHDLRMEAADYVLDILDRHGGQMSQDLRDAYLVAVLRLLDAGFYVMPWESLLPGR